MHYEETILDFLLQEENLGVALEVAERIDQLKTRLHEEFWLVFGDALREVLIQSRYSRDWEVEITARELLLKDYAACSFVPRPNQRGQHFLEFALQQGTSGSDYPLYYGIHWNEPPDIELGIEQVDMLSDELKEKGFRSSNWWIGYKYLDYYAARRGFVLQMGTRKEEFIQEMVDLLWALFEAKSPLVEVANQALKDLSGMQNI